MKSCDKRRWFYKGVGSIPVGGVNFSRPIARKCVVLHLTSLSHFLTTAKIAKSLNVYCFPEQE